MKAGSGPAFFRFFVLLAENEISALLRLGGGDYGHPGLAAEHLDPAPQIRSAVIKDDVVFDVCLAGQQGLVRRDSVASRSITLMLCVGKSDPSPGSMEKCLHVPNIMCLFATMARMLDLWTAESDCRVHFFRSPVIKSETFTGGRYIR